MNDGVWMCKAPSDTRIWAKMTNEWRTKETRKRLIQLARDNDEGMVLKRDAFPPCIYGAPYAEKKDYALSDIFIASSLPIVSQATADILHDFDLGQANLYSVPVLKKDKQTPVGRNWFYLNYGNVKHAFLAEKSANVEPIETTDCWSMPLDPKDGDVAISSDALGGADIWVDPKCLKVFFMSDAMVSAIKAAGLKGFWLAKCQIV